MECAVNELVYYTSYSNSYLTNIEVLLRLEQSLIN